MGTAILLTKTLQLQDPLELKIYQHINIIENEILIRQQNYVDIVQNQSRCFNLTIALYDNNSLRENPYALFVSVNNITEFGIEFDFEKIDLSDKI